MTNTNKSRVMAPFRVLDMADESGVFCTKILAALGADVIKVEPPGGDPARNIGPFLDDKPDPEKSLHWFTYNLNKRSITLDISSSRGKELFKSLAAKSDFLVECFAPGYMESLGLGYEQLKAINPRLIMTSITPFGAAGPFSKFKGSNLVCMAMSGFLNTVGDEDRPPVQIATPAAYIEAGLQAAAATMVAFWSRQQIGKGQHIDMSVREAIMEQFINPGFLFKAKGIIPTRDATGVHLPGKPTNRGVAKCKDGYVLYHTGHFSSRQPLREFLDSEGAAGELMDSKWDPIFKKGDAVTIELRKKIDERFREFAPRHTKKELVMKAQEMGAQLAKEQTISDVFEDPHLRDRGYFVKVEHPELGRTIEYGGSPFKSTAMTWTYSRRAPLIGEHNQEIYNELGLSEQEIQNLKTGGII
jgi:benzylsuccinate CoA-transferase BbsE subunit